MRHDLLILALAFAGAAGAAELLGATDLGTALGIGQLGFTAALVWILLR